MGGGEEGRGVAGALVDGLGEVIVDSAHLALEVFGLGKELGELGEAGLLFGELVLSLGENASQDINKSLVGLNGRTETVGYVLDKRDGFIELEAKLSQIFLNCKVTTNLSGGKSIGKHKHKHNT